MPKYIPTADDLYEITPCVICGEDTGSKNKDTCSWQCENEKTYWKEFYDNMLYDNLINNEDET